MSISGLSVLRQPRPTKTRQMRAPMVSRYGKKMHAQRPARDMVPRGDGRGTWGTVEKEEKEEEEEEGVNG